MINVIIPTYGPVSFLREAIQFVLDQDYFTSQEIRNGYELIVIDDGSLHKTGEAVESFGERVMYYYQQNRGISVARIQSAFRRIHTRN